MEDKRQKLIKSIQPKKGLIKALLLSIPLSLPIEIIYIRIISIIVNGAHTGDSARISVFSNFIIIIGMILLLYKFFESKNARKREYISLIENHRVVELDKIATSLSLTYEKVKNDLEKMCKQGFFGNAHIDSFTRSIVLPINDVDINTKVFETTKKCPTCGATCKVSSIGNNKCEYCGTVLD